MIRADVHYAGRVQGVGFRYTTQSLARRFDVTGWVQNLPDGRVRLVVEGASQEVEALLTDIADRMAGHIRTVDRRDAAATGEFARFEIRY